MGANHDALNRIVDQHPYGALRLEGTVSEPATVSVSGKPFDVSAANRFSGAIPAISGTTAFTIVATDASGNSASKTFEVDSGSGGQAFTFDANGNVTSDGIRSFTWDAKDRLRSITTATSSMSFTLDGLGRRVQTVRTIAGTQTTTVAIYCGLQICEE